MEAGLSLGRSAQQTGNWGGARRFETKIPSWPQASLRGENFLLGDEIDQAARSAMRRRLRPSSPGFRCGSRVASSPGFATVSPVEDRRGPAAWRPTFRPSSRFSRRGRYSSVTGRVGRDVPGVPDREEVKIRRVAEFIHDFERGGFLAGDSVRID